MGGLGRARVRPSRSAASRGRGCRSGPITRPRLHGVAVRRAGRSRPRGTSRWAPGRCARKARVEKELFAKLGYAEDAPRGVLVLEGRARCRPTTWRRGWRAKAGVAAGGADVRGRARRRASRAACRSSRASIETGLHKMETLGFDVTPRGERHRARRRCRRWRKNDMRAIGRTNDCVLYGGQARYTVRRRRRRARRAGGAAAGVGVGRLRHAVLRHLQALRQRLLQDRPDALQPGRSLADERHQRPDVPRRPRSTPTCCARRCSTLRLRLAAPGMNVVILSARTGWHTDELCRALAERGHAARVVPYEGLVARLGAGRRRGRRCVAERGRRRRCFEADAVLARIIPNGSLEQIIYRVDALHWLEERGVPVINSPRAIERSVDKFYTTALLQEAGLPTPETVVCERAADAMAAVRAMGDVIIKPIFGSMGHGMVRVSDPDVAFRVVRALEQMRAVFYVQRAIDHGGRDVRAVRRRRPGARRDRAARRRRRLAHQRVARRARPRRSSCRRTGQRLAVRAAAAVGADYAGVDLLPARDGARVRARGQRHSRVAGAAAGDRPRRRRRDRRARGRRVVRAPQRAGAGVTSVDRDRGLGLPALASTPADVAAAAQLACLLEAARRSRATSRRAAHFADSRYERFRRQRRGDRRAVPRAGDRAAGRRVREAVEATARWTASNTNLGIVLLLAPLARAALVARRGTAALRSNAAMLRDVLDDDDRRRCARGLRGDSPRGAGRPRPRRRRTWPTSRR